MVDSRTPLDVTGSQEGVTVKVPKLDAGLVDIPCEKKIKYWE